MGDGQCDEILLFEVLASSHWDVEAAYGLLTGPQSLIQAARQVPHEAFHQGEELQLQRAVAESQRWCPSAGPVRPPPSQFKEMASVNHRSVKGIAKASIERAKELKRQHQFLLEKEEAHRYLENYCRTCPKCGRVFEHIAGCSDMVCGQDYHGGNTQPGCRHRFSLQDAGPVPKGYFDGSAIKGFDELRAAPSEWHLPDCSEEKLEACLQVILADTGVSALDQDLLLSDPAAVASFKTDDGWNLLHVACASPIEAREAAIDMHVCQSLLFAGLSVEEKTPSGTTALCLASRNGNLGACRAILNAKADVNARSRGSTALHAAVDSDLKDCETASICKALHACKADLNAESHGGAGACAIGKTPLVMALNRKKAHTVELLSKRARSESMM